MEYQIIVSITVQRSGYYYVITVALIYRSLYDMKRNICCLPGARQQTRHTPLLRSNDGRDGPDRCIEPVPHTMRAVIIIRPPRA